MAAGKEQDVGAGTSHAGQHVVGTRSDLIR
jgi:hypothetical protein